MTLITTVHDLIVATLEKHREARAWNPVHVATDLAAQLGLDPAAAAPGAPVADVTPEQVTAAEEAAHRAVAEYRDLATRLDEQRARAEPEVAVSDINPASPWPGQTEEVGNPVGLPAVTGALVPSNLAAEQAANAEKVAEAEKARGEENNHGADEVTG